MILETMTVKQAAETLGVHLDTLYEAIHNSDRLRAVRASRKGILILAEDVRNFEARPYGERRREEEEGER